jgi:hypothetical protein
MRIANVANRAVLLIDEKHGIDIHEASLGESAPATIPATSEATFNPGFAPLSVGTVTWASANSRRPARSANASTGTSPDRDWIRYQPIVDIVPKAWLDCLA